MKEIKRKSLNFKGKKIFLNLTRYQSNGRLAIFSNTKDEPFCDVTINLPKLDIDSDLDMIVAINEVCKSSGLEKALMKEKIIDSIMYVQPYNYGNYDIAFLNLEKLYEYDPDGFIKHLGDKFVIVNNQEDEMEA